MSDSQWRCVLLVAFDKCVDLSQRLYQCLKEKKDK